MMTLPPDFRPGQSPQCIDGVLVGPITQRPAIVEHISRLSLRGKEIMRLEGHSALDLPASESAGY